MNAPPTLVEYGSPIDAQSMVTPADTTELELEPGHPGLGDQAYIERRRELFALCRRHRLEQLGPPIIKYTSEETRIWREVSPKLDELHQEHASEIYLQGKTDLAITREEIPQLRLLSDRLRQETNMHLVPAEGALSTFLLGDITSNRKDRRDRAIGSEFRNVTDFNFFCSCLRNVG